MTHSGQMDLWASFRSLLQNFEKSFLLRSCWSCHRPSHPFALLVLWRYPDQQFKAFFIFAFWRLLELVLAPLGTQGLCTPLLFPHCTKHSHCTRARFSVLVSGSGETTVRPCPLLCLQKRVAERASGLSFCWSLLRNNNMATLVVMEVDVFPSLTKLNCLS